MSELANLLICLSGIGDLVKSNLQYVFVFKKNNKGKTNI